VLFLFVENKNQRILPSFLVGLANIEVFKGDRATFGCKVTGYPAPRVLWYLKGERCKDGKKYKIGKNRAGCLECMHTITIAMFSLYYGAT